MTELQQQAAEYALYQQDWAHAATFAQQSYDRNLERIRNVQGLPIEVLQSIQALDTARREYLRAVVDYNTAQFRLHRALGWPIGV